MTEVTRMRRLFFKTDVVFTEVRCIGIPAAVFLFITGFPLVPGKIITPGLFQIQLNIQQGIGIHVAQPFQPGSALVIRRCHGDRFLRLPYVWRKISSLSSPSVGAHSYRLSHHTGYMMAQRNPQDALVCSLSRMSG